jgi:hypothetical protein
MRIAQPETGGAMVASRTSEVSMALDCGRLQSLVMKMQQAFLDTTALTLTLSQAERRFAVDAVTCEAVLGALVSSGVLTITATGQYVRFFPRVARGAAA